MAHGSSRKRSILCDASGTPLATGKTAAGPVLLLRDRKTQELAEKVLEELQDFIEPRKELPAKEVAFRETLPLAATCQGRLTLTTGTPVTTSDVTDAATLYWTPFVGNRIALYDGTKWNGKTFVETSLRLAGITAGKNYDVFVIGNGPQLALQLSTAWTSNTVRAESLTTQDGITVRSSDIRYRWLGTLRGVG